MLDFFPEKNSTIAGSLVPLIHNYFPPHTEHTSRDLNTVDDVIWLERCRPQLECAHISAGSQKVPFSHMTMRQGWIDG